MFTCVKGIYAENTDLATALCLTVIDQKLYLRTQMKAAVAALMDGKPIAALGILQTTLDETDVGTMKEWLPGEEPF
jgi:uncharacterized protein with von Willebrand factor type A (vWA) domain